MSIDQNVITSCMIMHPFFNFVCHMKCLYTRVLLSGNCRIIIFVGHLVQVVRVYKNEEQAEVQFTVSS